MPLFNEVKRRNVFKVAIAYVVMASLVMQVADVILNNIEAPGWVFHVLLLFLGVGFIFAVVFSWAFELTPEGLKREHEVDRSRSITRVTGRKLDFIVIGVMAVALAYLAYDKLVLSPTREPEIAGAITQADSGQAAALDTSESTWNLHDPMFTNIHDDPRWLPFLEGIGMSPTQLAAIEFKVTLPK